MSEEEALEVLVQLVRDSGPVSARAMSRITGINSDIVRRLFWTIYDMPGVKCYPGFALGFTKGTSEG